MTTLYRDTRKAHKTLYPDGKKCAIPSLHRDSFPAKVPGPCPVLRRVTQPPHIAGPLYVRCLILDPLIEYENNSSFYKLES